MLTRQKPMLKGSHHHIYHFLMQRIREDAAGRCTLSYDAISELTGYCPATVKKAVRTLVAVQVIQVQKEYPHRTNTYLAGGQ